MIAPAIVFLLLVMVYPLFDIFRLSLFEFAGLRAQTATFVGLKNFGSLLQDRIYWISMKNTLIFVLGSVVFHALVGGIFALILNQHWPSIWLRNVIRGLLILPWLFSLAAAGLIWALFLNPLGPLNYLFVASGLVENPINFLGEQDTALWSLIAVNVWKAYPFYMIMILGGLQTIPPDLYAAAQVDGAGRWQRFSYITLPLMRPVLVATTAIDFITTFGVFDLVRTLTEGGPARSTITLGYYAWRVGFLDVDFGYGAAISVSMLLVMSTAMWLYLHLGREEIYG
ncbi:MAG: sugar ABC transporter permease [Anaerolineae bacterium]|nr:MAG: sugar ABC transporter permease [Anaerolineae bacterium]